MHWRGLIVLLINVGLVASLPAGIFFNRPPRAGNQAQRVQELIGTLKSDPKESQREAAAEELRNYDPKAFPEIVAVLLDALRNDPKPSVRLEAAQSLGKFGPLSADVGRALEHAAQNDSSFRVRWQARNALAHYPKNSMPPAAKSAAPPAGVPTTSEPPLAAPEPDPVLIPPPRPAPPMPSSSVPSRTPYSTSNRVQPTPAAPMSRPMPATSPLVPAHPPLLHSPPAMDDEGPELNPPK